jgi:hypothetical protein
MVFSACGVRVTRSLALCVFCRSTFVLFLLPIVCSFLIYGFWLPLWYMYLQTCIFCFPF